MRISAKIDYGCRALLELSLHWPTEDPLQINTIAARQKIPLKFLTQILIALKQLGYVQSLRGKRGGYLLAKPPAEIVLSEVLQNLGYVGYAESDDRYNNPDHVIHMIWKEMDSVVIGAMNKINFLTIAGRQRSRDKIVMFQI